MELRNLGTDLVETRLNSLLAQNIAHLCNRGLNDDKAEFGVVVCGRGVDVFDSFEVDAQIRDVGVQIVVEVLDGEDFETGGGELGGDDEYFDMDW